MRILEFSIYIHIYVQVFLIKAYIYTYLYVNITAFVLIHGFCDFYNIYV